jgi:hypothetical protein
VRNLKLTDVRVARSKADAIRSPGRLSPDYQGRRRAIPGDSYDAKRRADLRRREWRRGFCSVWYRIGKAMRFDRMGTTTTTTTGSSAETLRAQGQLRAQPAESCELPPTSPASAAA